MKKTTIFLCVISCIFLIHGCNGHEEIQYYPNGMIKSKTQLDTNGLYNGYCFNYNRDGILVSKVPFIHGLISGILYQYYSNGIVHAKELFVNNKRNGLATYFYKNNALKSRKKYNGSVVIDTSYNYYENGRLQCRVFHTTQGKIIDFDFYTINGRRDILYTRPIITTDADTIEIGRDYYFAVLLANRLSNSVIVKISSSSSKIDSLHSFKGKNYYLIRKPKPGLNLIRGKVYNLVFQDDTLFTYNFILEHKFFVRTQK